MPEANDKNLTSPIPNDKKGEKTTYISLRVENVITSVDLAQNLDLSLLMQKYQDIEKKENFPGLVVKIGAPKATILMFSSGKLVITGLKLTKSIPVIIEKILLKLENAGIKIVNKPKVKIENIVLRGDFHSNINLDMTSLILDRAVYEPEVFPGLIYKTLENNVCFLIFNSGKIICTGGKDEELIKIAVKNLGQILKKNGIFTQSRKKIVQLI